MANRLIPKKSKVDLVVFKNFTLLDIILLIISLGIVILILLSNIDFKFILLAIFIPLLLFLFLGNDETKIYKELVHVIRFLVGNKRYGIIAKKQKKANSINLLFGIQKIISIVDKKDSKKSFGLLCYDGYFGAVLEIGSIEYRLLSSFEQNQKISQFAQALNSLQVGQICQLVKIERPVNFDDIAKGLYDKVVANGSVNENNLAKQIILKSRLAQTDEVNNIGKIYNTHFYLVFYEEKKDELTNLLDVVQSQLLDSGLKAYKLTQKQTAMFVKYNYGRDFDEREFSEIEEQVINKHKGKTEQDVIDILSAEYIEYIKPNSIHIKANSYQIDGTQCFAMAVKDYPLTVGNAYGAKMFSIPHSCVVLNIKPVAKERATKRLDKTITEVATRNVSNKASQLLSQSVQIDTMVNLLDNLQNENENLFDCTITLTAFNNTKQEYTAFRKDIRREIMSDGFKPSFLGCRQLDGFITSSVTRRNACTSFERGINSESIAAIFPFVFTNIIEQDGLMFGYKDELPVVLDVWKRDSNHTNSNMFILGKSGGGKSYFVKILLSLLHSDNCSISILDPENEYAEMTKNFDGKLLDVGNAVTGRINPFHIYDTLTDDGAVAPFSVSFASHLRFLESFFKTVLPGIATDSIEELNNIILKVYEHKKITSASDGSKLKPNDFPIFDDLGKLINKEVENNKDNYAKHNNLLRVQTYVSKFCGDGRNANLWNGYSTLTASEDFKVFNFQSLFEGKNQTIANGQMLLVLRYLEQEIIKIRELNRGVAEKDWLHPVIVLDEGYNFIDPNYPIALDFVYSWYKRIRKYGGLVAFITQNLGDIFGNKEIVSKTTAIVNNSQYSFIFGLAPADIEILTDLYRNAGEINETEQNEIANAGRGECFLISSPKERTSVKIVASPDVKNLFESVLTQEQMKELLWGAG